MTIDRPALRYAITGMGLGNAEDFRDLIAPFVGELTTEAEALGCAPDISPTLAGDNTFALVPERGPAVANTGHDLVVGFLLVVSGSVAGGVAQAVGADIYDHALKKPVAGLARRLRNKSPVGRQATLLAETWLTEEKILVQAIVNWRPDQQQDLADVLTDALEAAEKFWRESDSPRPATSALEDSCIIRIEIATDGTMTQPAIIDPHHRIPGMPRLRPPASATRSDVYAGDDQPGATSRSTDSKEQPEES